MDSEINLMLARGSLQNTYANHQTLNDFKPNVPQTSVVAESLLQDHAFDSHKTQTDFKPHLPQNLVMVERLKGNQESSARTNLGPGRLQCISPTDWKKDLLERQQQKCYGITERVELGNGFINSVENNDDNSWMNKVPIVEENYDEQQANFNAAEKAFKDKCKQGMATIVEEIAFRKYERLHQQKMQKRDDDDQIEAREEITELAGGGSASLAEEDSLFVRESDTESRPIKRAKRTLSEDLFGAQVDDGDGNDELQHIKTISKPLRKSKKAKDAKRNTSAKVKSKKAKAPTKKALAQSRAVNNIVNVSNLLNSNVFRDTETNTGHTEIPTFTSTNRSNAMKELISSLPAEYRGIGNLDKKQVFDALKSFTGRGSCGSDGNGQWKVQGMASSLSHYQMLGVSVMRERETQLEEPRGGILADQMGLGKTVMMIANIVNGMKVAGRSTKPTLIVAPPALLTQWMDELVKHADAKVLGEIIRYHGIYRLLTQDPIASLSNYNIILTTYNEVAKSYPKYNPPAELTSPEEVEAWWSQVLRENSGPLHNINFHRVILDEAQAIKNHSSQTSMSCRALKAVHRWAISGTPVQNSLAEFYPYFKFLQVPFTGSFRVFKRNFCSQSDTQGIERLSLYLRKFMIRRTHNDSLFGAKLLVLPKPTKKDLPCHFSQIEREIYMVVRTRFVLRINGLSRAGQLKKNYSHILTMLLRLRQLVAHPLLIQDTLRDLLEAEDFDKLKKITQLPVPPHSTQAAILNHLRMMLRTPQSLTVLENPTHLPSTIPDSGTVMEAHTDSANGISIGDYLDPLPQVIGEQLESIDIPIPTKTISDSSTSKTGNSFGLKNSYADYLDDLHQNSGHEEEETPRCSRCDEISNKNYITSCDHAYCHNCLLVLAAEASANNQDRTLCIVCGFHYTIVQNHSASKTSEFKDKKASTSANVDIKEDVPKKLSPQQVVDNWVDASGHMLPSAKTLAIKAQIMNWFQESPGCKIIIYSQFITMIRIITKICSIEQWGAIQFTGLQSIDRRAQGLKRFESDPKINILIASLKTGGVGLNLTCASKILMVDLWWNSAVEDQAFCRSYRRGQTRETEMTRLLATNTVDADMVKVQKRKDQEIGGIMVSEVGKKSFTATDMLSLFGTVDKDENGREFILVNDRASYAVPPRPTLDDAADARGMEDAF